MKNFNHFLILKVNFGKILAINSPEYGLKTGKN